MDVALLLACSLPNLALWAGPTQDSAPGPEPEPEAPAGYRWGEGVLDEEVRAVIPRLTQLMRDGLRRTEPSVNIVRRTSGASLFDGSYDWHSNLFAHWALLVQARVAGDDELAAWVLEPLTEEALGRERKAVAELDAERLITFPYDQGWLLLVLAELERASPEPRPEVRAFRLEVEGRLLDRLETADFPDNDHPERLGGRRFVGFYRSWLFSWYQVRLSQPIGEGALERLAVLQRERIAPQLEAMAAQTDPHGFDFLFVPAVPELVADLDPFDVERPDYPLGEAEDLPEGVELSDVHLLGVEISRLWPLAIHARRGDAEARAELHRRWRRLIAREDLWAEDFTVVTHWVPQFLWMTIWLADGRP